MSIKRLQGPAEKAMGVFYEFDLTEEPLGEGGMGKVYHGVQVNEMTGMKRDVAVKFVYENMPEQVIERARREAAIQIKHENLVEMLGFIETVERDDIGQLRRRYHVVSELLVGVMLDDLLSGKLTDQSGAVVDFARKLYEDYTRNPYRFALFIVKNILAGLTTLHDKGYIHRDIDPTNIMLTSDGKVKLIDFGIAKQLTGLTSGDKSLTVSGAFMGKPEYAAPELVLGDIKSQGVPTDIYAVGILLFQCIVGHVPFEGDKMNILDMQLKRKPPLDAIKNRRVRKIIAKALKKDRQERYQSASAMRGELDALSIDIGPDSGTIGRYVAIAACAAVVIGVTVYLLIPKPDVSVHTTTLVEAVNAVDAAYAKLTVVGKESEGLEELRRLSESGSSDATFRLSRLYFEGKTARDALPTSMQAAQKSVQAAIGLSIDNQKAHSLLEEAVQQDPCNYQALYELGLDYLGGSQRAAGYERKYDQGMSLLNQARDRAQTAQGTATSELERVKLEALLKEINTSIAQFER